MDANRQDAAGVGVGTPLETAQELCEKVSGMIVARRIPEYVGAAMNGGARAPSDPRAVKVRGETQRDGGYSPIEGRLTLDACDMADGVPLALVLEPRLLEIEWLKAHAKPLRIDRPMGAVAVRETKAQCRLDLCQLRLAEQPHDPAVIRETLEAADHYAQPLDELRATLRQRLILSEGGLAARQFVGRRRGALALQS